MKDLTGKFNTVGEFLLAVHSFCVEVKAKKVCVVIHTQKQYKSVTFNFSNERDYHRSIIAVAGHLIKAMLNSD
jgi:hypothetical protein